MRVRTIAQVVVAGMVLGLVGASPSAQGAPEPGVVHFTAGADYGETSNTNAVLSGIAAQDPDLNIAVGDLSYSNPGGEQAWCDRVTSRVGAGFPFQLLTGNHESNGQDGNINDFSACLPNQLPGLVGTYGRQWYVDVPQVNPLVRFVMISPAMPFAEGTWSYAQGTPRYNWTAAAIDGARSASIPWVVVGTHKPCQSVGLYSCELEADLQNLLLSKRVDLVLNGHEHHYQRTKQLALGNGCTAVPVGAYDADCVVDSDNDLVKGSGTVFATVGTGGVELRDVNESDPEAGYFAAYSGLNVNPSFGLLDVRATADTLEGRFVPVTGTYTDAFAIRRGTPPPANTPPTAAFTSTSSGATASFDGTGSDDPDGEVISYAWTFGDGTTGTGATPQHAYAAGGTYQVGLTVTDDRGGTGTITQPVTITAPPGPVDFVTDTFSRTASNGWGSADTGGPWTISGTAANFAVSGGTGSITLPAPGQLRSAWLGATTRTDTDLRLTLSLDKVPTGNGVYLDAIGRRVSTNNEYRARLVMAANGRITVQLTSLRGTASPVAIATAVTLPSSIAYAAGTPLNVRLQVTGTAPTTVRLKVWPASQTEPVAWQTTATDSYAALQNPGAVGVAAYLSGSVTNAPVTLRVDDVSGRPVA